MHWDNKHSYCRTGLVLPHNPSLATERKESGEAETLVVFHDLCQVVFAFIDIIPH